jgi:hypothetical protein
MSMRQRVVDHIRKSAQPDGTLEANYVELAAGIGIHRVQVREAMKSLLAEGIVVAARPPAANGRTRPVWRLAIGEGGVATFPSRSGVSRADNRRVSLGLLARLIKFHGDRLPPRRRAVIGMSLKHLAGQGARA